MLDIFNNANVMVPVVVVCLWAFVVACIIAYVRPWKNGVPKHMRRYYVAWESEIRVTAELIDHNAERLRQKEIAYLDKVYYGKSAEEPSDTECADTGRCGGSPLSA